MSTEQPNFDAPDPGSAGHVSRGCTTLPHLLAGRYELFEVIGEGGMGTVHRARDHRLERDVAIKSLKPGVGADSPAAARFLVESVITGQLQHPGIPPVYELGSFPDGGPFLAMKLVKGRTLRALLKERPAPADELGRFIAIFEQVAHAIGYSHSRRVIHRDIKPANVMVGAHGEVQVMDWGLAKVLVEPGAEERAGSDAQLPVSVDSDDPDETVSFRSDVETPARGASETRTGAVMGTPAYMPAEQARGDVRLLDPRSDVFGLGAVLCEILTGRPPYSGKKAADVQLQALKGEMTEAMERLDAVAAEKEWVSLCKRCLAVDQADRPVDGLAVASAVAEIRQAAETRARQAEVERERAVVLAAEHRKRRALTQYAAVSVATVLLVGLVASLWQMNRANKERDYKNAALIAERIAKDAAVNERNQKELERKRAESEKANAVAVRDFLRGNLVSQASVWQQASQVAGRAARHDVTVRELLDRSALEFAPDRIDAKFPKQFQVQCEILETIGEAYESVGEFPKAIRFMKAAAELREKQFGASVPSTLAARINLAFVQLSASRQGDAVGSILEVLRRIDAMLAEPGSESADDGAEAAFDAVIGAAERRFDVRRFRTLPFVADGLFEGALAILKVAQAIPTLQKLADRAEARFGVDDRRAIYSRLTVGFALHAVGKMDDATATYERTLARAIRQLGEGHVLVTGLREMLAAAYQSAGRKPRECVELLRRNYEERKRLLGPDHPSTVGALGTLASAEMNAGDSAAAVLHLESCAEARERSLGMDHPDTLQAFNGLGAAYQQKGDTAKALAVIERIHPLLTAKLGPDHQDTLTVRNNLATLYLNTGKLPQAIEIFEQLRDVFVKKLGADHPRTLESMANLAAAYQAAGRLPDALKLNEQIAAARKTRAGAENTTSLFLSNNFAAAYLAAGRIKEAIETFERIRDISENKLGPNHPETLRILVNLGAAYDRAGRTRQAVELLERASAELLKRYGADHSETITAFGHLVTAYGNSDRVVEAAELAEKVAESSARKHGAFHPSTLAARSAQAALLVTQGKHGEAAELFARLKDLAIKNLGEQHDTTLMLRANWANSLSAVNPAEAAKHLEELRAIVIRLKGEEHMDAFAVANNLSVAYEKSGKLEAAISLNEEVLKAIERKLGADHPYVNAALNNLAIAYGKAGRRREAVALYERAVRQVAARRYEQDNVVVLMANAIDGVEAADRPELAARWRKEWLDHLKRKSGANSAQYAAALAGQGLLALDRSKYEVAEPLLRECLSLREKILPDSWSTFNAMSMLGAALLGRKNLAEAGPLLHKGYEGMKAREKTMPKEAVPRLLEAIERLVQFHEAFGNKDEAAKWRQVLETAKRSTPTVRP